MNSDYILNVLETVKFVFCLQIHALAECTMNSKFCILHEAAGDRVSKATQNHNFYSLFPTFSPNFMCGILNYCTSI